MGAMKDEEEVIDASGFIISPGFINTHVHLGETIYADFIDGKYDLESYIEITNKIASASATIEDERKAVCDYSMLQLIKSGTTTIAGGRTSESSERFGIRNVSGYMLMRSPKLERFSLDLEPQFERFYEVLDRSVSYPALFIHSLGTVDEEILLKAQLLKKKYNDLRIMAHVAETRRVETESMKRFGMSSVQTLRKYDLLNSRTLLVHGNNLSVEDISLIRESGSSLAHCLSSNIRVADGVVDIQPLTKQGVPVSIATDGFATSGTLSVLSEAVSCYSYHNKVTCRFTAQEIFDMITINPAKALDMAGEIGSIEPGKRADIVFLKAKESTSNQDPVLQLVTDPAILAETVIVGGKMLFSGGELLIGNEKEIDDDFFRVVNKVKSDLTTTSFRG